MIISRFTVKNYKYCFTLRPENGGFCSGLPERSKFGNLKLFLTGERRLTTFVQ